MVVIGVTPGLAVLVVSLGVTTIVVASNKFQMLNCLQIVLMSPGDTSEAGSGSGGCAPVADTIPLVAGLRLYELTDQGYPQLDTVLAVPGPYGRQLLTVREDNLLGQ